MRPRALNFGTLALIGIGPLFAVFFVRGRFSQIDSEIFIGAFDEVVENRFFLDENVVRGGKFLRQKNIIPNLPFETDVGDESLTGLRIDPRQVARIGVAVRIPVFDVKNQHKVITIFNCFAHLFLPLLLMFWLGLCFIKTIQ